MYDTPLRARHPPPYRRYQSKAYWLPAFCLLQGVAYQSTVIRLSDPKIWQAKHVSSHFIYGVECRGRRTAGENLPIGRLNTITPSPNPASLFVTASALPHAINRTDSTALILGVTRDPVDRHATLRHTDETTRTFDKSDYTQHTNYAQNLPSLRYIGKYSSGARLCPCTPYVTPFRL
jgi:hypothetical protein